MKSLRHDCRLPHPLFAPVILASIVLAVYYPAISSGIHSIDDPGIFAHFSNPPSLFDILMPGRNYYYRPIIELSYYFDSKLWGMEPSAMHLENILLHISNTYLVFLISRKITTHHAQCSPYIPLMAAILFALHPLNVEAISWIAGRTDPLAAFFILSACFYLLCWLENPKWYYVGLAPILFGFGMLTKESAFAFMPVSLLLVLMWPELTSRRRMITVIAIFMSMLTVICVVNFILKIEIVSYGRFTASNNFDATECLWNSLVAFGFYVKKLLIPLPLNFAITDVSPLNGLLGFFSILVLVVFLVMWRLPALFFTASALMILPALIVATKQIAWTPFAERYMYMSTAFLCVGTSCLFLPCKKINLLRFAPLIIPVICIEGLVSFQRNLLWKDKLAFYQDAVRKSPGFGSLYNELGGIFIQQREVDKAADAFAVADRLNKRPSMKIPIKANIMATIIAKGNYVAARDYFYKLFGEKKNAPAVFLDLLYSADSRRLETIGDEGKVLLAYDLLETLGLLNQKKPDPFWLYRSGQIALVTGNSHMAADFFRRAYFNAPQDAYYKTAAKTYFLRLETGK